MVDDNAKEESTESKETESKATTARRNYTSGGSSKTTEFFGYKVNNTDLISGAGLALGGIALAISGYLGWNWYQQNKKQEDNLKKIQDEQIIANYMKEQEMLKQQQEKQAQGIPPRVTEGYVDMEGLDNRDSINPNLFNPYSQPPASMTYPDLSMRQQTGDFDPRVDGARSEQNPEAFVDMSKYSHYNNPPAEQPQMAPAPVMVDPEPVAVKRRQSQQQEYPSNEELYNSLNSSY